MMPTPMTCQELVELVTSYLDGSLALDERARFEAHLVDCHGCLNYMDQMRNTIRLVGTLTTETISDDARDRLLDAFREWKQAGE